MCSEIVRLREEGTGRVVCDYDPETDSVIVLYRKGPKHREYRRACLTPYRKASENCRSTCKEKERMLE